MLYFVIFLVGWLLGGFLTFLYYKNKSLTLSNELNLEKTKNELHTKALLAAEKSSTENKDLFLETFKSVAHEALERNNKMFIDLASQNLGTILESSKGDLASKQQAIENMVAPIKETLNKVDSRLELVEQNRIQTSTALSEQIKTLSSMQDSLRKETSNLTTALKSSSTRGRWGEIALRRILELSGMLEHCDFVEQVTTTTDTGTILRPDVVVSLPGNKHIVIDSKTPFQGFIESIETEDSNLKQIKLKEYTKQVKSHINQLSVKAYWNQFDNTPEFIVMFMPGEAFFAAVSSQDLDIIEYAIERKVILSTPTTLIALLKSISFGWQQEDLRKNAQKISDLGIELYDRIKTFVSYHVDMKKGLDKVIDSYNKATSSLESRVLVSARKMNELGTKTEPIEDLETVDRLPKLITLDN